MTAPMTAWLDYVDARRRLIQEWAAQGVSAEDIAIRIELDPERVSEIIAQDPSPLPGCARFQVWEWRRRCERLERELHTIRTAPPSVPPPTESEFRALRLHPDPECCGCRYWREAPAGDRHHPHCEYAPRG